MSFDSNRNKVVASIVVPVYNSENTIQRCLQAIINQDFLFQFEIIVVDDGSDDSSAEIVKKFSTVHYLHQTNKGPAAARNRGAGIARGRFLVFTDSDCIPRNDWLTKLLDPFLNENQTGCRLGCTAGSYDIANPQSLLARCIHEEIRYRHLNCMPRYPRVFGSYNCAIKREAFLQVGGFDEHFRHASGEDNDLSYRLIKAGWSILFLPEALVAHHHPTRLKRYLFEQMRHGYWRARLYIRHPDMMRGDDYTTKKDIIEIPVCLSSVGALFLLGSDVLIDLIIPLEGMVCLLLLVLQGSWAVRVLGMSLAACYFSGVLILRAYARTAGLMWGLAHECYDKLLQRR